MLFYFYVIANIMSKSIMFDCYCYYYSCYYRLIAITTVVCDEFDVVVT